MAPVAGSERCFAHAPEKAPDHAKARKRGGEARETPHLFPIPGTPTPLRDTASVQVVLERIVSETLAQRNGHERSRAVGSLLLIALKALEVGELEGRIAALEQRLGDMRPRRMA